MLAGSLTQGEGLGWCLLVYLHNSVISPASSMPLLPCSVFLGWPVTEISKWPNFQHKLFSLSNSEWCTICLFEFWGYCCHVLVLQARSNQLQCGLLSPSCVIPKVICVGVGWVWHTRLVMFHIFVSLCTSHIPQLTDTLAQTEQELEDLKLAQARMEANNSARIAAQSAGIPLVCTEGFICSVYMHWGT